MADARPSHRSSLSRRLLLQGASALGAVVAFSKSAFASAGGRPNILFIMADDLGYADLSCYGRREYRTATLDQLAADGLRMTDGYSGSAVCSATRIALITGRYHQRLEAGLDEPLADREEEIGLPPGIPTLPSLLQRAGYFTSLVGKWHMGAPPRFGPLKSGYERFFGIVSGAADYFTHRSNQGEPGESGLYEGTEPIRKPGYLTDLFAERAVGEIREAGRRGKPYFISLHFTAPHWPWEGPGDEALAASIGNLNHLDGGSLAKFGEMVLAMDAAIARVLAEIDARGERDNTIIVFTSDNGGERFSDNWPFSGRKTELLEGGIRVPVIVRWPSRIKAGSRSPQVIASIDWLPTLLAAAGAAGDPGQPPDGENLLEVLTGQAQPRARKLFWRFNSSGQAAVRDGDWKYLKIGGSEYLFDVAIDPLERANLKGKQPRLFERLRADHAAWNAAMLPYVAGATAAGIKGRYPDRY